MTAPLGPSLELQGAVVAALRASADLQSFLGNPIRLYEDVPDNPMFPYCTIGEGQNVPDLVQDFDCSEVFLDIHVWSRAPSFEECKRIGASIIAAMPAPPTLSENRAVLLDRRNELQMLDADGVTKHGIYSFRALIEPAS